jgi:methylated-DNA-[protein]-cysteine S-methyltransferase
MGKLYIVGNNDGISYIGPYANQPLNKANQHECEAKDQLEAYFAGKLKNFTLSYILPQSPPFYSKVWQALSQVPYGARLSYGQLATLAGNAKACRAVGSAMASNPLPIIVPCHRVINYNNTIGHYSLGGVDNKRFLLAHEAKFYVQ